MEKNNTHILFNSKDFYEIVEKYESDGYEWIFGDVRISVSDSDFPIILQCDSAKTMLYSKIEYNKDRYFSDPSFVSLYKNELRKHKFKRLRE